MYAIAIRLGLSSASEIVAVPFVDVVAVLIDFFSGGSGGRSIRSDTYCCSFIRGGDRCFDGSCFLLHGFSTNGGKVNLGNQGNADPCPISIGRIIIWKVQK